MWRESGCKDAIKRRSNFSARLEIFFRRLRLRRRWVANFWPHCLAAFDGHALPFVALFETNSAIVAAHHGPFAEQRYDRPWRSSSVAFSTIKSIFFPLGIACPSVIWHASGLPFVAEIFFKVILILSTAANSTVASVPPPLKTVARPPAFMRNTSSAWCVSPASSASLSGFQDWGGM